MPTKKKEDAPQTVGEQYIAEAYKEAPTRDPIELQREMQKLYISNLDECTEQNKKRFPQQDFFIVVLTKRERLMEKIFRFFYFARLSCPTPEYDQAVWHYTHKDDRREFLWCVPDESVVWHITREMDFVLNRPDHKELVKNCWDFVSGDLLKKAQLLNKEIQ